MQHNKFLQINFIKSIFIRSKDLVLTALFKELKFISFYGHVFNSKISSNQGLRLYNFILSVVINFISNSLRSQVRRVMFMFVFAVLFNHFRFSVLVDLFMCLCVCVSFNNSSLSI